MNPVPLCKTCIYWCKKNGNIGACLRFPPIPIPTQESKDMCAYPVTGENDWCGEFTSDWHKTHENTSAPD